ncbi:MULTISPECIES: SRPBCC family protein [Streptomyces]|uniref:Activator of Hsp90 ATPase homologue 1/2-like C-terminal domain-containing protein n=2 Tax=Streptomyces TaxID=1883 RepID=A0A0W7WRR9_9ACTN|nr:MULTISPECIES: SRPBCC domain-containing protein [Streptomyces]KUF13176.1 hypothetical protein AT728_34310 [Streptomyces silvensis]MVO89674.1 toxin-antitoxin system toxin subunit [Streptomyces typhae]
MHVSAETVVPAPPGRVWELVTTPEGFARWYAFGGATIDLRPGGTMALRWDEHGVSAARVVDVQEGRLWSFRWEPGPGALVEISLLPAADGTDVRIVESGDLEDPGLSEMAWQSALGLLRDLALRED